MGPDPGASPSRPKKKMASFRRLISQRDSVDTFLMTIGTLGAIGAGCSQPLLCVLSGDLIDAVTSNTPPSEVLHKISQVCLDVLYTAIGVGAASILEMAGWTITAERQAARIRCTFLRALLWQDVGYFDQEIGVGDVMNKLSGDILLIQDALGDKVANCLELTTRFVFGWGVGFYLNWKMALVIIAAIPPIAVMASVMAVGLTKATNQAQEAYRKQAGLSTRS